MKVKVIDIDSRDMDLPLGSGYLEVAHRGLSPRAISEGIRRFATQPTSDVT